jgi:aminopeptidase-like protein
MYSLAKKLFPICRSLTGDGVRLTLNILKDECPEMKIFEIPSGTQVFDWTIPKEWNIREAFIEDSQGNRVVDFQANNLHVVGYSTPVDKVVTLDELQTYLYSLEEQPDWIPYVTSYYNERFGFCLSHSQRMSLKDDSYRIFIDSDLMNGSLTYGEVILEGEFKKEVFFSTYICHPSMANNELSGPCVQSELIKYVSQMKNRKYTYRFIFIPETIGSIAYLSKHLTEMKENMVAGFCVTCVGDERGYSYLPSRDGNTLSDRVAKNVLHFSDPNFVEYSFLDRGSDERQYCSPGVDLPVCSIMRSKYGEYPEYHTSADNLDFISQKGLEGSFQVYQRCIEALEKNERYQINCLCEPQLGKRGLYPTISKKGSANSVASMMNFIAYADGKNDLIDISNRIRVPIHELEPIIERLKDSGLLSKVKHE